MLTDRYLLQDRLMLTQVTSGFALNIDALSLVPNSIWRNPEKINAESYSLGLFDDFWHQIPQKNYGFLPQPSASDFWTPRDNYLEWQWTDTWKI